jgi:hypothetical protein
MDIDNKLNNYLKITVFINNVFRPKKTVNKTRMKLYNTLALPTLLYSSDNWTIKAREATEMKYIRRTAGYTWADHKTNTEIAKELNITPVLDKIQDYKRIYISLHFIYLVDPLLPSGVEVWQRACHIFLSCARARACL